MEFTTRFGLHSQATRLEGAVRSRDATTALPAWHRLRAMAPFKGDLDRRVRPGNGAGPYATTPTRAAAQKCAAGFGDGLFPVRSPLLGESRLFSFPPLINMLKSGGYSRLI